MRYVCIKPHLDLTVGKTYRENKIGEIKDDVGHRRDVSDLLRLKKIKEKKLWN